MRKSKKKRETKKTSLYFCHIEFQHMYYIIHCFILQTTDLILIRTRPSYFLFVLNSFQSLTLSTVKTTKYVQRSKQESSTTIYTIMLFIYILYTIQTTDYRPKPSEKNHSKHIQAIHTSYMHKLCILYNERAKHYCS